MSTTPPPARFIREDEVRRLLDMPAAIAAVDQAFRDLAEGEAVDVPRQRTSTGRSQLHILQGASKRLNVVGFKAYYPRPAARTFHVNLLDLEGGHTLAIIEADWMGIMRTGAATAVATRALARPDADSVACFGTGRHGLVQLEAVCAVRPVRTVWAYGRDPSRLARFRAGAMERFGLDVSVAASPAEALDGAGIVNIVTRSSEPLFDGRLLQPGQHVNAVGVNALSRRELDLHAIGRADRVVVDSIDVARLECGDLLPAIESGLLGWRAVAELGDVLTGRTPGRRSAQDLTLFESQGMAIEDLYVGVHVLAAAKAAGIGVPLPFGAEPTKTQGENASANQS